MSIVQLRRRPLCWRLPSLRRLILFSTLLGASAVQVGCATVRTTDPPRTATELFLLNVATERAVESLSFAELRDREVYVTPEYVYGRDSIGPEQEFLNNQTPVPLEQAYLMGEVRAKMLTSGVRLKNARDEAEIIAEVRVQSLGIDRLEYLFGLPRLAASSDALTGGDQAVVLPELSILKNLRQKGYSALAVVAYWRDSGELISSTPIVVGRTSREDFWIFGIGPRTVGNIPSTATE